jgi:N6-adenosine-specific RNA methylase IME4
VEVVGMPWRRTKRGGYTKAGTKRGGYVRNTKQYEALRRKGHSKASAARITNASARKRRRKK